MNKKQTHEFDVSIETYGIRAGQRLREERTARGMTTRDLAAIIGSTSATISRWENGKKNNMSPDMAYRLSKIFGVSFEYMAGMNVPREARDEKAIAVYNQLVDIANKLNYKQLKKALAYVEKLLAKADAEENIDNVNPER